MRRFLLIALFAVAACATDTDDKRIIPPARDGGTARDAGPQIRDAGDPTDAGAVDSGIARDAGDLPRDGGDVPRDGGDVPRDGGEMAAFNFYTPSWTSGDEVPTQFTCDAPGGFNHNDNPEIIWENPPAGTQAFVMVFDDPDARGFIHWAFYTTDATVLTIAASTSATRQLPAQVIELTNGARRRGYVPNCPGGRFHTYRWRIWAVDAADIGLTPNSSVAAAITAAEAAALGTATFTGRSNAGG